jgi:hypothetical protein
MSIRSETAGSPKLLSVFLLPSWLSGLISALAGVLIIGGTVLLTHIGGTLQQGLLGLNLAYQQSSGAQTVSNTLAQNTSLNNVLLFVLWGTVGLVVYSIVQNVVHEFSSADKLVHELHYVHADRHKILRAVILRAVIRLAALVAWWLLVRFMAYKLVPYDIAAARLSALHLANATDWVRCILGGAACMLGVHGLTILLRLLLLRPRVFGGEIFE